jgi:hypothetical protein
MKMTLALSLLAASLGVGCASSQAPSQWSDMTLAERTIRDAAAAGATHVPVPADLLARATSAVEYAHHLPGDPDHAHRLCEQAQVDAELATVLTRVDAIERRATKAGDRVAARVGDQPAVVETPPAAPNTTPADPNTTPTATVAATTPDTTHVPSSSAPTTSVALTSVAP